MGGHVVGPNANGRRRNEHCGPAPVIRGGLYVSVTTCLAITR